MFLLCYFSKAARAPRFQLSKISVKKKLSSGMIKHLLNSVIAKRHDLSVSRSSVICLNLRLRQIIDLLHCH